MGKCSYRIHLLGWRDSTYGGRKQRAEECKKRFRKSEVLSACREI